MIFKEVCAMKQSQLARWLKTITIIAGVAGMLFFFGMIPAIVRDLGREFPELNYLVVPCLVVLWAAAVPCLIALVEFWGICSHIAEDNSFCRENARSLQIIGKLALLDTIACFAVTAYLFLNHACNPGVILLSFGVMIAGTAIAIAAMTLSHLVDKAIRIKEDNELTI